VPPRCHRRNAAERAIRTFKEKFVSGQSSVDPTFPLHLWYRLSPQAEIKLNLMRTSRLHPQLSAAAHFHGLLDYNKTVFAPPGFKIIAHKKPGKRRTWAPHRQHGYSLGPAMHHYRCQNVYISSTASERIVDTLEFFPHKYQMPQLSSTDRLLMAAKDMTDAIQNPHPEVPFAHIGDDTISALAEWLQFSNSNYNNLHLPRFQLRLPRSNNAHPFQIIQSNLSFYHAPAASDEITDENSHTGNHQRAITSKGGHTKDAQPITSESAHSLAESLSPQPVPRRLLWNGHCPHGHRPQKKPLISAASCKHCHPPRHRKEMEYMALMKDPRLQPLWKRGFGNECGRLFQGIRDIPGTDTCFFIKLTNVPKDRKITYGKIVCDYKPHKKESNASG
jgi:hypothetical protein